MGSAISAVIGGIEEKETEQRQQTKDSLTALEAIAELRRDLFYSEITSPTFNVNSIEISKVLYKRSHIACKVTNSSDSIGKAIEESISAFVHGDITEGITTIVKESLDVLLGGDTSASEDSTTVYAITTGSLGGLMRIDTDFYLYRFKSASMKSTCETVLVSSIVVSTAKTDGLTANDINGLVQTCYPSSPVDQLEQIRNRIWSSISAAPPPPPHKTRVIVKTVNPASK